MPPRVRLLIEKEFRQLSRRRGAIFSSLGLPALLLLVVPIGNLVAFRSGHTTTIGVSGLPLGLLNFNRLIDLWLFLVFPLMVSLTGILAPAVAAIYTVVTERERRSLELLVALPVTVADILLAKLVANLVVAMATMAPLFAVDAVVILVLRVAGPDYVISVFVLLLASLAASVGVALLMGLLAKDFRTANNLNAAFSLPAVFVSTAVLVGLGGQPGIFAMAGVLIAFGTTAVGVAFRWLTFERYLA